MMAEFLSVNEKDNNCWVFTQNIIFLPKIVPGHFKIDLNGELHQQKRQNGISAIVSRSGRLNRTGQQLDQVHTRSFHF